MKVILFSILLAFTSTPKPNLIGSIWTSKVAQGCVDTLKLKSGGKATSFSCELDYAFQCSYVVSKDTLIIILKDDSHPEDGGKTVYYKEKYLITNKALYIIGNGELIKGKWKYNKVKKSLWYKRFK